MTGDYWPFGVPIEDVIRELNLDQLAEFDGSPASEETTSEDEDQV